MGGWKVLWAGPVFGWDSAPQIKKGGLQLSEVMFLAVVGQLIVVP